MVGGHGRVLPRRRHGADHAYRGAGDRGFGGRDPAPTLAQFTGDVAAHRVAYFVVRGIGHGGWGHGRSDITDWVGAHFSATKAGDATVYDLSRPK